MVMKDADAPHFLIQFIAIRTVVVIIVVVIVVRMEFLCLYNYFLFAESLLLYLILSSGQ